MTKPDLGPSKNMKGWYFKMVLNKLGVRGRLSNFPLQFADTGEPAGGGAGTPPAADFGSSQVTPNTENQTTGQAATPPSGTVNQGQSAEQQLQAALRGMNDAQRERAAWLNTAKEYGFNSVDEAKQAFDIYKAVNDPNQAGNLIENYLSQNPDLLKTMLSKNPLQSAQLFGQIFNGQQAQVNPYDNVTTYEQLAELMKKDLQSDFEKRLNTIVQPIQQTMQAQKDAVVQNKANSQIDSFMQTYPSAGVTQQAVWDLVKIKGIPMTIIDSNPWIIDGLIMESIGGKDEFAKRISSQSVQQYQQQVKTNAKTATLSPTGGVTAIETKQPLEGRALTNAAHNMLAGIIAAQKT